MKIALAGIVKNEGHGIFEWVMFHSLLGFDKVIVFDNNSTDTTRSELERAATHADVDIVPWPRHPGQIQAYDHCLSVYGSDYDFIAFLDADEFLVPGKGDIKSVLARMPADAHVAVHWLIYGSSGHVARPDGLVTESYLHRAPEKLGTNRHVKSIVRTQAVAARPGRFLNPHFVSGADYVTPDGKPIVWAPHKVGGKAHRIAGAGILRINHYYTKSRADYDLKIARANADTVRGREDLFDVYDHNDVSDPVIPERFGEILERIRALNRAA